MRSISGRNAAGSGRASTSTLVLPDATRVTGAGRNATATGTSSTRSVASMLWMDIA